MFWSKPTPPPPPEPPAKKRPWALLCIVGVIGLSVASAGCKDRRLLDGTNTSTTSARARPTTTGAATGAPVATVPPTAVTAVTAPPVPTNDYVVASGDTMVGIAKKFGVPMKDLLVLNNMANPDRIQVGQKIKVPAAVAAATTVPVYTYPPQAATYPPANPQPQTAATFPPVTVAPGPAGGPQTSIIYVPVIVNVTTTTIKK